MKYLFLTVSALLLSACTASGTRFSGESATYGGDNILRNDVLAYIRQIESAARRRKNERGIWQRRYWEHQIRDERDLNAHIDYIHFNPVKHGYVGRVSDWPYSSFHRYVQRGILPADWAGSSMEAGCDFGE